MSQDAFLETIGKVGRGVHICFEMRIWHVSLTRHMLCEAGPTPAFKAIAQKPIQEAFGPTKLRRKLWILLLWKSRIRKVRSYPGILPHEFHMPGTTHDGLKRDQFCSGISVLCREAQMILIPQEIDAEIALGVQEEQFLEKHQKKIRSPYPARCCDQKEINVVVLSIQSHFGQCSGDHHRAYKRKTANKATHTPADPHPAAIVLNKGGTSLKRAAIQRVKSIFKEENTLLHPFLAGPFHLFNRLMNRQIAMKLLHT